MADIRLAHKWEGVNRKLGGPGAEGQVSREAKTGFTADAEKDRLDLLSAFPAESLDEGPGLDDQNTVEVLDLQEMMVS